MFSVEVIAQEKSIDLEKGKEELFYGNSQESIVLFEKALKHYQSKKNDAKIAELHNQLSKAYRFNFDLKKAMFHANKALEISRGKEVFDKRQEANALDNIGLLYAIMRRFDVALSDHQEALRIRSEYFSKDSLSQAISFYNIGNIFVGQSKFKEALNHFQKALNFDFKKTLENQIFLADIDIAFSRAYYDQGKFEKALSYLEKGLFSARKVFENDNPYFAEIYNKLGVIYSMKEQLNESLNYYKKALSVSIKTHGVDKHFEQVKIHFNMGTIYRKQGLKEKALHHTQKTLDLGIKFLGEDHERMSFPYSQMGQIYENEQGIPYIEKALNICKKQPKQNVVFISYLYEYLSNIYFKINDYPKALESVEESLKMRRKAFGENNVHTIRSLNMVSKLYITLKDFDQALVYNRRALDANTLKKIDEDMLLESVKIKADIYFELYNKLDKKEYLKESVDLYQRAISLIDNARRKKRNYEDKIAYSETIKSIYARNIKTILLLNQMDTNNSQETAFIYSEKSKANVLKELMKSADAKLVSNLNKEILQQEDSIKNTIAKLNSEVLKEMTSKERDSQRVYSLEGQLADEIRRRDSLEKRIETDFPSYHKLKYENTTIQVSEIQKRLDDETTLIEFFKSDDILYVFTISNSLFHVKELLITDLDEKIQDLNTSIINKNQSVFSAKSFELYQLLFKPLEEFISGENLVVIPDESLWHLQFELLMSQKDETSSYLLYDYAISYGNSATLFFSDSKSNSGREVKDECIAFSYSNDKSAKSSNTVSLRKLRNSQIDLPGTRKEILEISKLFEGTYFYGNDANETNFKENGNRYKLVHLALHGEIDHVNPKNSKIYFTDSKDRNKEDNTLYGHELYALKIPADLVVLSACNTGSGQVNKGEGVLSLGNAFQYAGAKSLVLSRWEISDKTTPVIIKSFYENLAAGMSKNKALQKAKIQFLENSDVFETAPFYWGSFYLIGDIDPINIEASSTNYLFVFSILIGVLIFILLIRRLTHK